MSVDTGRSEEMSEVTADSRTDAEHDCDRILYSDELRRLGGVTQVVAVGETSLFHTRLTHTLKVQQLSRRLAEHLVRNPANAKTIEALGGLDPNAAEAAGLAHDLGHPPFGHVGEAALNRACHAHGLDGFEGNAQTFRILTKLSSRGGENPVFGLELSDRTLRAVIKYPWMRTAEHSTASKWNAYPTEAAEFNQARAGLAPGARSPEAAIMDWADDITYAVHDLEDFIRLGRVPIVALRSEVERAEFVSRAVERLAKKHPDIDWVAVAANFGDMFLAHFAQFGTHDGTFEDLDRLRSVCRTLINGYVSAASLQVSEEPLSVPPLIRGEVELFKQLTWHYVIHDPKLATLQQGHARVVAKLFGTLYDWLDRAAADKETFKLPRRLVDLYELTAVESGSRAYGHAAYQADRARKARAVGDYIASLTEAQAFDLAGRFRGTGSHSVTDPWLTY